MTGRSSADTYMLYNIKSHVLFNESLENSMNELMMREKIVRPRNNFISFFLMVLKTLNSRKKKEKKNTALADI